MKKFRRKNKGSLFSLLMMNYILFTVVIIVTVITIAIIGMLLLMKKSDIPFSTILEQKAILESGNYEKLMFNKIVGKNGSIEILDENNNVIYRSGNIKDEVKSYSETELDFIPNDDGSSGVANIYEFEDENENKYILLMRSKGNIVDDGFINYDEIINNKINGWFEVLDSNLNVIFKGGNVDNDIKAYTKEELGYLLGVYPNNKDITKYRFTDINGKKRTAITKYEVMDQEKFFTRLDNWVENSVKLFIFMYVLCIIGCVVWLRRKVKKPLFKLENAMHSLAEGKSNEPIEYSGPREFVDICDSFNIMADKLKESESEKDRLSREKQKILADISHDLKTPITTIQGYAKALSDGLIAKEDEEKYLNIIYSKSSHLTALINIFYEYSKLEHPDFKLLLTKEDLCEYLRAYVAFKYEDILEAKFEIEVDIPERRLYCNLDKLQLQRVFDNLIINSIKHNPKGTKIYVGLEVNNNDYKVIIADNGIGISKEIAENIFEAFIVGDESRNTKQGSGLGLAIAKKIVEMHGGNIYLIANEHDEYKTRFEIFIPKIKD